jgi:hypothetical protein
MTDEIRVKLTIASATLSARDVSRLLGIEAESSQVLGEMNRLGTKTYPQHVWMLKDRHQVNGVNIGDQIEECMSRFLLRVAPASSLIRGLSTDHQVEIGLYVFAREVPSVRLSKAQIESLTALGASFDVDIVLYDDEQIQE